MPSTGAEPRGAAWDDARVLALRPAKNPVDPFRPYAAFVEPERTRAGVVEDVATLLLTNRECPFRCLMCDLWKNTTDARVPPGAIPAQIDHALNLLPPARHIKLYNAGNFFDAQSIPPGDLPAVAARLSNHATVVIECHPKLIGRPALAFRERLNGNLEVALGLETVHPAVLPRLNKRMTLEDFRRAAGFLTGAGVGVRAFLLVRPPWLGEEEGVEWALRSVDFAFDAGVECCVVIPTRAGNGAMEELARRGEFTPPRLASLEQVLEAGLARTARLGRGRVFADLWDVERLAACPLCAPARIARLRIMNHVQTVPPPVRCDCAAGRPPHPAGETA